MESIFKHILLRISGMPFGELYFRNNQLLNIHREKIRLAEKISKKKIAVSAAIHAYNETLENIVQQRLIQNLRRDIYNGKKVKDKYLTVINELPEKMQQQINSLLKMYTQQEETGYIFSKAFTETLSSERKKIKSLALKEHFLKGISLSSHVLYEDIIKYATASQNINSNHLSTERSILKYLIRMCAKTSPFSTFTSICITGLDDNIPPYMLAEKQEALKEIKSIIRLNNMLLTTWKRVFSRNRKLWPYYWIKINPTCRKTDDEYSFIIIVNNTDYFRKITASGIIDHLVGIVENKKLINLRELILSLLDDIDGTEEELYSYIDKCLQTGLLEIHAQINELSITWEKELQIFLDNVLLEINSTAYANLGILLNRMENFSTNYTAYSSKELVSGIRDIYAEASSVTEALSFETNIADDQLHQFRLPLKPENIFYEDTVWEGSLFMNKPFAKQVGDDLFGLYKRLSFFEATTTERIKMFLYFKEKYGIEKEVLLLDFYEDYFKQVKHREKTQKATGKLSDDNNDPMLVTFHDQFNKAWYERETKQQKWKKNLTEKLLNGWKKGDDMFIHHELIDSINHSIGFTPNLAKKSSAGAFIQFGFDHQEDRPYAVLNSMSSGFGKMYSRFLSSLPEHVTGDLLESNMHQQPADGIFAELSDGSSHNANVHPPIMPFEINIPGGHFLLAPEFQIKLHGITVVQCTQTQSLKLFDKQTKKFIYPFDLGFQVLRGRSTLYQILTRFSYAEFISPVTLTNFINDAICSKDKFSAMDQIVEFPRVYYNKHIILQRKSWMIPIVCLPVKEKGESDDAYFSRLQQWKQVNNIPTHIFLRITDQKYNGTLENDKFGKDNYKPLYINLDSPLFISLFDRMIQKADGYILMEEMLPDPEALLTVRNATTVTELYMQIGN